MADQEDHEDVLTLSIRKVYISFLLIIFVLSLLLSEQLCHVATVKMK